MKKNNKLLLTIFTLVFLLSSLFVLASCDAPSWLVEEDTMFYLDNHPDSTIMGIPFLFAIDRKKSGIILRKDGTATVTLVTNSLVSSLLALVPDLDQIQLDAETKDLINTIANDYFPGFDIEKPIASLELLEKSVNLKLVGLDDPDFQAALTEFGETGSLPKNFSIPKGFGVEYNCKYYLSKVSSLEKEDYTAVHLGKHSAGGEGPILLTLSTNEEGKRMVTFRFGVLGLFLSATER